MGVTSSLVFNPSSIPDIGFLVALLTLLATTMLVRGDSLIRASMLAITLLALPWVGGTSLVLNLHDRALIETVGRFFVGVWTIFGYACLLFVLVVVGLLERYRKSLIALGVVATITCALTWATDLVVDGTIKLAWATYYPAAGPLFPLHIANLGVGSLLALYVCFRNLKNPRLRPTLGYVTVGSLGLSLSSLDVLMAYGLAPYPVSAVTGTATVGYLLVGIFKFDALRIRGLDRAAAYELGMFAILVPLVITATWAASPQGLGGGVVVALLMLLPVFGGAQAATLMLRHHIGAQRIQLKPEHERALERFVDRSGSFRTDGDLRGALFDLLELAGGVREVCLYISDSTGALRSPTQPDKAPYAVDHTLSSWFLAHAAEPIDARELNTRRLGPAREPLQALIDHTGRAVLVPLIDREVLVGMIAATPRNAERALHDSERQLLQEAGRATARALTFIGLFREAEARIELSNELEVAAAVQNARTPGEVRSQYEHCVVIGHYHPAARFGGDWWSSHQLPGGRVLVAIGDVMGRGVPAALVSSTAAAACRTAQAIMGASCDVRNLLELLNDAVLSVGGEQYGMSGFAAIVDPAQGTLSFANAGSPFPYLCRPSAANPDEAELHPLISRGTRLGTSKLVLKAGNLAVRDGDMIVFVSDAVVDSQDPAGKRYGDRRLQHVLRRYVLAAGEGACGVILDDVLSHCGERPVADDLIVIVVHVGKSAPPRKRRAISQAEQ